MSLQHAWWRYLKRVGTVGHDMKTRTVNGAFWWYLEPQRNKSETMTVNGDLWWYWKRFWNAENNLKTMTVNGAFWCYLKQFGTAEKKNENKCGKWWIRTVFETIWKCCENFENKHAYKYVHYDTIWNFSWNCNEKNSTCFDLIKVGVR